jgi:hypothetical protein
VKYVPSFWYLGSVVSEEVGVKMDTAVKIPAASTALNRLGYI